MCNCCKYSNRPTKCKLCCKGKPNYISNDRKQCYLQSVGIVDIIGSSWPIINRVANRLWHGKTVFKLLSPFISFEIWGAEFDRYVNEFKNMGIRYVVCPTSSSIFNAWLDLLSSSGTNPGTKYPEMIFIAKNLGTIRLDTVSNAYRFFDIQSSKSVVGNINAVYNNHNMPNFIKDKSKMIYFNDGSSAITANVNFIKSIAESKGLVLDELVVSFDDTNNKFPDSLYHNLSTKISDAPDGSVLAISMSSVNTYQRYFSFTNAALDNKTIFTIDNKNIDMYIGSNYLPFSDKITPFGGLPLSTGVVFNLGITSSNGPTLLKVVNAMGFPLDEDIQKTLNASQYNDAAFISVDTYGFAINGDKYEGITGTLKFDENRNIIDYYIKTSILPAGASPLDGEQDGPLVQNPRWVTSG
jgi:hypothetical protein